MSSKAVLIKTLVSLATLALIVVSYLLYSGPLFDVSYQTIIPNLQARGEADMARKQKVWDVAVNAGLFTLQNGQIVFILANNVNRAAAFYFVCVYVASVYLVCISQIAFHRPAPFWVSPDIHVYDCTYSFAAPTGNVELATSTLVTLWSTLAWQTPNKCGCFVRTFSLLVCCFVILICSYGHMLNGAASIDQLLLGCLLGVWTVLNMQTFAKKAIFEHTERLHRGQIQAPDEPLCRYFAIASGSCLLALVVGMGSCWIYGASHETNMVWEQNVMSKCSDDFIGPKNTIDRFFRGYILVGFGQIGYLLGAYSGILLQYRCFEGLSKIEPAKEKSCLKAALRTLMLISFAVTYQYFHGRFIARSSESIYLVLFLLQLVPSFVIFFLLFGLSDALFLKLGLYDLKVESESEQRFNNEEDESLEGLEYGQVRNRCSSV